MSSQSQLPIAALFKIGLCVFFGGIALIDHLRKPQPAALDETDQVLLAFTKRFKILLLLISVAIIGFSSFIALSLFLASSPLGSDLEANVFMSIFICVSAVLITICCYVHKAMVLVDKEGVSIQGLIRTRHVLYEEVTKVVSTSNSIKLILSSGDSASFLTLLPGWRRALVLIEENRSQLQNSKQQSELK